MRLHWIEVRYSSGILGAMGIVFLGFSYVFTLLAVLFSSGREYYRAPARPDLACLRALRKTFERFWALG